jgi:hypothetical protein
MCSLVFGIGAGAEEPATHDSADRVLSRTEPVWWEAREVIFAREETNAATELWPSGGRRGFTAEQA